MHMALRSPADAGMRAALPSGIEDASAIAAAEREKMRAFVAKVHDGTLRGATGERFEAVLNIGIGGSDLGPRMASEALTLAHGAKLKPRFLSNVDGHALAALTRELDPARTLVLAASKTFTTLETMENANAARAWIAGALGEAAVGAHFAALSTNARAVGRFGIAPERMFGFRDWVGGRYSLWSSIGLSIALAAGWDAFQAMLDGGRAMDLHFRDTDFADNLPVLLALVDVWHVNILNYRAHCVLAYDARLSRLPAYLQQLEMESNGKSVALDGASRHPRHLPGAVRRARHRRPAQLHAARAPGHPGGSGGFPARRHPRPRPAGRASCARRQRLRAGRGAAARQGGGRGAGRNDRRRPSRRGGRAGGAAPGVLRRPALAPASCTAASTAIRWAG